MITEVHKSSVYRIGSRLAIRPASELISQLPEVKWLANQSALATTKPESRKDKIALN